MKLHFLLAGALLAALSAGAQTPGALELHTRARSPAASAPERTEVVEAVLHWDAKKTAIIICDMWDRHWCQGATARVNEMAPRMNQVLTVARQRGVRIIHAPSDTMKFYADYPQRKRAQAAPKAATAATELGQWKSLNRAKEGPLPIDDSDGGCDDVPPCPQAGPWRSQIATLGIEPEDVISDNGEEVYNVLQQLGIENVIILGVHTNMCVLGRSFSIRSMVGLGKHVLLMRDLTDTMYNSRRRPWVSHFVGTDLVVEHIEKFWCPTITSADFLGGQAFQFQADRRPRIVFLLAENEYHTWETVPEFARAALAWRGFRFAFVTAGTRTDDYDFQNPEALRDAELVFVSTRRRALPKDMLVSLRQHLAAGKPLIGIRTASHAFAPARDKLKNRPDLTDWPEFDAEVLGGNYSGHYPAGNDASVLPIPGREHDPILAGVSWSAFASRSSLYKSGPLRSTAQPLLTAALPGQPAEPVAWRHTYGPQQARVFYTSLGGPEDFQNPQFRRLLLNAFLWALDRPLPPAEAKIESP